MKRLFLFAIVLVAGTLAFGQAARYDSTAQSTSQMMGRTLLVPLPSASVTVCSFPAAGGLPCTNKAQVCTDSTASSCSSSAPNNPVTADSLGNFGFYVAPGAYDYTVCPAVGTCQGPYHVFVPGGMNTSTGSARLPNVIDVLESAQPANPTASVDRLWLDSTSHTLKCITSSGANCAPTGGGGGATPGGANTNVQYNCTGNLCGSANFTFDGTTVTVLNLVGSTSANFSSIVANSFKLPVGAGYNPTQDGAAGYDSTNKDLVFAVNGAKAFAAYEASLIASGNCLQAGTNGAITSAGIPCGVSLPGNAGQVLSDNGSGGFTEYPIVGGGSNVPLINYNSPQTNDDICVGPNGILTNCTPGIPVEAAITSAGYTVGVGDKGQVLPLNNASAQTLTLPGTVPAAGFWVVLDNIGAGTWSVSPNGHNIDGAASSVSLPTNNGISVYSDGSNYFTMRGIAGAGGGGGSTAWSGITNPAGSLSLTMAHNQSTFTYDATTGASANLFNLIDTANNTGTGSLFTSIVASGSAANPVLFGTTPTTAQTATALVGLNLITQTAADSTHNYYSPQFVFGGRYWTGAADATDKYTFTDQCAASGSNPNCTFAFDHSGSSGGKTWAFNGPVSIGGIVNLGTTAEAKIASFGAGVKGLLIVSGNGSPTANQVEVDNLSGTQQWAISKAYQTVLGADGSGTNIAGTATAIRCGLGTGTGALCPFTVEGDVKVASGSTVHTQVQREVRNLQTTIAVNNTPQQIISAAVASNSVAGGVIKYCVHMDNATDFQSVCGSVPYNMVNKAGTVTAGTMTATQNACACSGASTLAVSFSATAANPSIVSVTANSSLTPSTMQITWSVENLSDVNDITVTTN